MKNEMEIEFDALSYNESFARISVAAFLSPLNPTLEELADIKTAVSEAVTNAIIHGYGNLCGYETGCRQIRHPKAHCEETDDSKWGTVHPGKVKLHCMVEDGILSVDVMDEGVGIENVEQAMEPLFTTKPELERSGMGFAFMEAFMDDLEVESTPGRGTKVHMKRKVSVGSWIDSEE